MDYEQLDLDSPCTKGCLQELPFAMTDEWNKEEEIRISRFKNTEISHNDKLKFFARDGVPMGLRRKAWLIACGGYDLLREAGDIYEGACLVYDNYLKSKAHNGTTCNNKSNLKETSTNNNSDINHSNSSHVEVDFVFGSDLPLNEFLPPNVAETVTRFLRVLHFHNKTIAYSPLIPSAAILLLMFMEPPLAYLAIQAMINRSLEDSWYFATDFDQFFASIQAFEDLAESKIHSICHKANSLGINIAHMTLALLPAFFLPFLPLPVAMTIFDSFVIEGRKILVRFLMCLLQKSSDQLLEARTSSSFLSIIVKSMEGLSRVSTLKKFLKSTFGINLQRERHMLKLERACLAHPDRLKRFAGQKAAFNDVISASKNIIGFNPMSFPRATDSCRVLASALMRSTPEEMEKEQKKIQRELIAKAIPQVVGGELLTTNLLFSLKSWIPHVYRMNSAKCIFSLKNDGTTMSSFWDSVKKRTAHFIMIKTKKRIFGTFITAVPSPKMSSCGKEFVGTAGSFVFDAETVTVYRNATPPNNRFFSVTQSMAIIGGPNPAICFEDGFRRVMSDYCDTFGSPPFVENIEAGDLIMNLEMYEM